MYEDKDQSNNTNKIKVEGYFSSGYLGFKKNLRTSYNNVFNEKLYSPKTINNQGGISEEKQMQR